MIDRVVIEVLCDVTPVTCQSRQLLGSSWAAPDTRHCYFCNEQQGIGSTGTRAAWGCVTDSNESNEARRWCITRCRVECFIQSAEQMAGVFLAAPEQPASQRHIARSQGSVPWAMPFGLPNPATHPVLALLSGCLPRELKLSVMHDGCPQPRHMSTVYQSLAQGHRAECLMPRLSRLSRLLVLLSGGASTTMAETTLGPADTAVFRDLPASP
ncbi:hypothetical protein Micbo1qcDRAFT_216900 [Microdochium bolleyi]|uniref:Uncharacterized protein n=1 Tax=Microdochium bolleyi TaxID=196109 RepID=A0A136JDK2_9PEZI|nr:hypothetical protein Micbo1qcDRAFT_216900 [Microdochium bolleyi]